MLIGPPSETPSSAARSEPTASITARTSSIRTSSDGAPLTRSDIPVPRLSNGSAGRTTRAAGVNAASDGICHASSTCETNGGMWTRSNGPSPSTWYAIETSPLLA